MNRNSGEELPLAEQIAKALKELDETVGGGLAALRIVVRQESNKDADGCSDIALRFILQAIDRPFCLVVNRLMDARDILAEQNQFHVATPVADNGNDDPPDAA